MTYYENMPEPTGGLRAMTRFYREKAEYEERKAREEKQRAHYQSQTVGTSTREWLAEVAREQEMKELERAEQEHRVQQARGETEAIKQRQKDDWFKRFWEATTDNDKMTAAEQYARACGYENGCGFSSRASYEATIKLLSDINRCPVSYRSQFVAKRRAQLGLQRY
jgi:hypothetical protein